MYERNCLVTPPSREKCNDDGIPTVKSVKCANDPGRATRTRGQTTNRHRVRRRALKCEQHSRAHDPLARFRSFFTLARARTNFTGAFSRADPVDPDAGNKRRARRKRGNNGEQRREGVALRLRSAASIRKHFLFPIVVESSARRKFSHCSRVLFSIQSLAR